MWIGNADARNLVATLNVPSLVERSLDEITERPRPTLSVPSFGQAIRNVIGSKCVTITPSLMIDELVSRGLMFYLARVSLAVGFGVAVSTVLLVLDRLAHQQDAPPGAQRILTLGTILVVMSLIL